MSKIQEYYEICERLYVEEGMLFDELSKRFPVSEKTLRLWADKGDWRQRKKQLATHRESLSEETYLFTLELMKSLRQDSKNNVPLDQGRCYLLKSLMDKIDKVQKCEAGMSGEPDNVTSKEADPEAVVQRVRDVLGLNK